MRHEKDTGMNPAGRAGVARCIVPQGARAALPEAGMGTGHVPRRRQRPLAAAVGVALGLFFGGILPPASAQVLIRKTAAEANPGIYLAEVTGPSEIQTLLPRILAQSDWFTVVSTPAEATYTLRARYSESPAPTLEMQVSGGTGSDMAFRQVARSQRQNWVVYQAVDTLIGKLFRSPGLCASSIAFVNGRMGYKEIFSCRFDGSAAKKITSNRSISTEPSWGPRAATLVYTLYDHGATDVVLADVVNQRQRRVSQFPGLNAGAALSRDGQWAALCLSRDRKVELYLLRVSDRALLRLTNDPAVESSPCWSPDGSQLCYVSDKAGRPNLYLIPVRGGQAQRLIPSGAEAVSPDWSVTANKICFATRALGSYDLAVVDMGVPTREVQYLTRGGRYESPSWAPDGRHIVCTHQVGKQREICMVDSWTGRIQKITTPGDYALPSWSDLHD
jgi:tol-pal system beta propeller repeat protein TolB